MSEKKPNYNDSNHSDSTRRSFIKRIALATGSITFVKLTPSALAQTTAALPPVVTYLLDDCENQPGDILRIDPIPGSANKARTICIPEDADRIKVNIYGAGGAGSGTAAADETLYNGADGGTGGHVTAELFVDDIDQLRVEVGEGGVAAEASELGSPGEFGGAPGGITRGTSAFSSDSFGAHGGAGGGYAAIYNGTELLALAGGGGGGGGSNAAAQTLGGTGGSGNTTNGEERNGQDGSHPDNALAYAGRGAFSSEGGGSPDEDGVGNNAEGFIGGSGGSNLSSDDFLKGGAGGGGGGGFRGENSVETAGSGGGGGGAGAGDNRWVGVMGGGGGGGAGGSSFVTLTAAEGSIGGETLSNGGSGGSAIGANAGGSGGAGRIVIEFIKNSPSS